MAPDEEEFSAGGAVVRDGEVVVVVPRKRGPAGEPVLGLPKGHPEGDETPAEAALREVREEAGITARVVEELGDVRYTYTTRKGRRKRKRVTFFLMAFEGGDPADHDHEIEEARWMPLDEAVTALTFEGEREIAGRALARSRAGGDR